MAQKKTLVCGAGIAGPTCAYWLQRYGYSVVLAEQARTLRDGGQNVDIKGAGQRIIREMGIAEKTEARNTNEQGQKYVDAAGNVIARFPKGAFGTLTSDFEILRGDFAQILFEATQATCEYRFGTHVTNLEEKEACISVTFNTGHLEDFELVICAEGIGSRTRKMILSEETRYRYLGAYISFFKIPRQPEDDDWACTVNGKGGTFITLRPGNDTETTVLITFLRDTSNVAGDDASDRLKLLTEALRGRGTVADRILADLHTVRDFYFGPMSQVQASRWSKGRFVIVGDAAYSPTPFTGEGTALAMVGAYVLAGEISRCSNYAEAFLRYEQLVRPYVERSQNRMSPFFIRLVHVRSRCGIAFTRVIQKIFSGRLIQRFLQPDPEKRAKAIMEDFSFPLYAMGTDVVSSLEKDRLK